MQSSTGFEINKLFEEAQTRWLKPAEVLFILQNHEAGQLTIESPLKPSSGSIFLFNRRVNRYFRRDGHNWRKKRDGRTVGEAHERLKVGNIDALNCYYAHGAQNPNFQRRSYWMLDPACDHIVLVHYREAPEGRRGTGSVSNLSTDYHSPYSASTRFYNDRNRGSSSGTTELYEAYQSSAEEVSSNSAAGNNHRDEAVNVSEGFHNLSDPKVKQAFRRLTEQLSLGEDDVNSLYPEEQAFRRLTDELCLDEVDANSTCVEKQALRKLTAQLSLEGDDIDSTYDERVPLYEDVQLQDQMSNASSLRQDSSNGILMTQSSGDTSTPHSFAIERKTSPSWKDMLELSSSSGTSFSDSADVLTQKGTSELSTCRMFESETGSLARDLRLDSKAKSLGEGLRASRDQSQQPDSSRQKWQNDNHCIAGNGIFYHSENDFSKQLLATREFLLGSDKGPISQDSPETLHEVDKSTCSTESSGRSTVAVDPGVMMLRKKNSFDWVDSENLSTGRHSYPAGYEELWDQGRHFETPLSMDSSITIAQMQKFSIREISPDWAYSDECTKVIITGDFLCDSSECQWTCMFGDVEVSVEIIQSGVLRCLAPQHAAGKVTLCITSGNRESCSEVREFEYRSKEKMTKSSYFAAETDAPCKTMDELLLLVRFAALLSHVQSEDLVDSNTDWMGQSKIADKWVKINEALLAGSKDAKTILDMVLQEFLKDELQQWLSSKCHGGEPTGCSLSKKEQGIIHMIAGLGYEWALNPVLDCGVSINFRDVNGWTALHWAAHFGREKMVAALIAAGASAGAVADPNAKDPAGKTPASIAASSGHKGLAGYLSEVALTSHLSSLVLEESEISKVSAAVEAERTVETFADRSIQMPSGAIEDQLSLKDSLAAVRNAAQAAARIQAAFRAHSFRKRQEKVAAIPDEYGMTPGDIHGLSAASKLLNLRDHRLNTAALSIQKKYRGWKGRKDFIALRQNVVKIQAHFRGHQVRKKYKEFLWTVGVLEKVVLRWRRKGVGLRGFRAESEPIAEGDDDDDILDIFRKQKVNAFVGEAMSRVLSVVDSPSARQQYRRMLESYQQAKADLSSGTVTTSNSQDDNMEYISGDLHFT